MSKLLECPAFEGNDPLTGELIWQHRIQGGSENIQDSIKTMYSWDGSNNMGCVAVNLKDGIPDLWQLNLFGKTKGVKLASSTFYTDQDEGTHIRIQPLALDSFVFRSMVSEWMGPEEYNWEFRLPSEKDSGRYYRIKTVDLPQYNLKPLWIRANVQVVPGPKLQVFIGAAPANDITELQGSSEPAFPLILLEKFSLSFPPLEDAGMGMATIPFLIDQREGLDPAEVSTNCPEGQKIKEGLAKFLQSSIKPNQRNEVTTWTREVASGSWIARAPNYKVPDPKALAGDLDDDEDDDDNTGQDYTLNWSLEWPNPVTEWLGDT